MSLLTNREIRSHWDHAVRDPKSKHPSQMFWEFLLCNKYFPEPRFFTRWIWSPSTLQLIAADLYMRQNLSVEIDLPAPDVVSTSDVRTRIFLLVESGAFDEAPEQIEALALDACQSHLRSTGLNFVYAMTTIGTSAKMWRYQNREGVTPSLEPMNYWNAYIEADSNQASKFSDWVEMMKADPPQ
ncbi:hypothetical protein MMC07_006257 [Pseudocyphellaria aurata]|nr:hypothetical protein [Pseudocyphellaria aurata]